MAPPSTTTTQTTTENSVALPEVIEKPDLEQPMLEQIMRMGKFYAPWIHSTSTKRIRIFRTDALEKISFYPWWYIYVLWTPLVSLWLYRSITRHDNSIPITFLAFFLGLFSFALVEYILHRFVFHVNTKSPYWNAFHFFAHGIHHLTPLDPSRLTFPPYFSITLGIIFYYVLEFLMGSRYGEPFEAGLAWGFTLYDTLHYYFHHGNISWLPKYFIDMKKRHLKHHFKNTNMDFGVTSPLFDYIFGTAAPDIATK